MELSDKHIVVTGGAGGIGRALVRRLAQEGARAVVVADRELEPGRALADEVGLKGMRRLVREARSSATR
jgi:NAD(P)-dependent dehydrogenase (short-subunit alcohol dehydrogenase family)